MAVFINYRREDSEGDARAVYNELAKQFGKKQLFIDVDSIQGGEDWSKKIDTTLENVEAVVVLIGRRWLQILNERAAGRDTDFVRLEIAEALRRPSVRVVPVLIQSATMPTQESLPDDIKALESKNAIEIRAATWEADFTRLIGVLRNARALPRAHFTAARLGLLAAVLLGTGVTIKWLLVSVPALPVGLDYSEAEHRLQSIGLKAEKGSIELTGSDSTLRVLDQEPKAGSTVVRGKVVTIILSQETPYPMLCRGLGAIGDNSGEAAQNSQVLHFHKAVAKGAINLNPGECSFDDRPLHSDEPDLMFIGEHFDEVRKALTSLSSFEYVCVINELRKHRFDVVRFKSYESFREGAWQPRNGDICGD